ncbi:TPA: tRNA (adenosine(37)-N6)-threonylcarbamoyltransferase complex ATPase subunit type 1 TsaE [Candidatus Komeilibacteria bacterium]|nr:MAG: hypothetical protein UW91_C0015G0005 [Parcubacteria group bacterium GW2011_GWF2_45_11]KKT98032.1 MAG: hypothetical protein UW98_C0011G0013 [Parcubacteria group bacterium GW2011_GWC2_45_15]OGY93517.1 MAG: tRNA (adenosine(37)-N6)-threonylcarbamoyltransferase complex ATPase subunit type 1 TsaE [Candidatus Komeilibacteria bacterium RIFOXYA2_FULL_45_9]OGY95039.1 MAG: tRNA (adenosine(37)-N6)-threonylcarbamoyltransferase complex ATPase subunit type 1 TsaE [Candidatus Komeilibacteria bacterium R
MPESITNNAGETKKLAAKISLTLKGGEVIGLIGDLGSGKTVFTQGLAAALGVTEIVNSPTFVLMKEYTINDPRSTIHGFIHVDAYRLNSADELDNIGLKEYLNGPDTVVVIEWADKVKDWLPAKTIIIEFNPGRGENQRRVNFQKII